MVRDYYTVLVRAVSELDPNNKESRRTLYDRARHAVAISNLSSEEAARERQALEMVIGALETEASGAPYALQSIRTQPRSQSQKHASLATESALPTEEKSSSPRLMASVVAAITVLSILAIAGYMLWPRQGADRHVAASTPPSTTTSIYKGAPSESTDASYIVKRQLVYYRTTHPVGTIVIAKSQRFLYLVRPNTAALRYTIGIGQECANVAGLLIVSAKEDWTELKAPKSPSQGEPAAKKSALPNTYGRFGARSLTLDETGHRIHGAGELVTSAAAGCFPLVDEDIIDVYDRVPVGTKVVMN